MTRRSQSALRFAALATLLPCLGAWGASGPNQGWIEVRSPHFVVSSNAGEKEARRVADQFEQIRALFHTAFPNLRVDPAEPVLILAAKNESTMKMLLPEEWQVKGHVHPGGLYQQGEDKHYVVLRLDSGGENPYHPLYHEYTHVLLHLNFATLPLWLDEGLAEFYGNSRLGDRESKVGTIDQSHLYILGQSTLLPIETLLKVEQGSSYYNEANQGSVFYAESWALVHYLMLDPEAHEQHLLKSFFAAWDKSGSQIEAGQQAFGDLTRFGQVIEAYSRQRMFRVALFKNGQQAADKTYAVRSLTAGEVLALRGDCASHRKMFEQAKPLVEQAVQTEPNLAFGHEALGYYLYRKEDESGADREMKKAMELGSTSFVAPYYHGLLVLHGGLAPPEMMREAIKSLEKATQINPQFAPAFEGLAQAYSTAPEMQKQALDAGLRALQLEPATHAYAINLLSLLLNADRDADARQLAQRILDKAASPEEAQEARALLDRIKEREQWSEQNEGTDQSGGEGDQREGSRERADGATGDQFVQAGTGKDRRPAGSGRRDWRNRLLAQARDYDDSKGRQPPDEVPRIGLWRGRRIRSEWRCPWFGRVRKMERSANQDLVSRSQRQGLHGRNHESGVYVAMGP